MKRKRTSYAEKRGELGERRLLEAIEPFDQARDANARKPRRKLAPELFAHGFAHRTLTRRAERHALARGKFLAVGGLERHAHRKRHFELREVDRRKIPSFGARSSSSCQLTETNAAPEQLAEA